MCAQYLLRTDLAKLDRFFGIARKEQAPADLRADAELWPERITPHGLAPVILDIQGNRTLRRMRFSLLPSWSKTERPKFATYNARIETLESKPTWREPFQRFHCLVPMTAFIEPIYENDWAGNMVQFSRANEELLVAAGIFDRWQEPETKRVVFSFAIITGPPSAEIAAVGHDRMPIFLRPESWNEWIRPQERKARDNLAILSKSEDLHWKVSQDRPLKPGWEKRK